MACSNAHAMPRRHCTSPGFNLARTTLRWVASRRCQTEPGRVPGRPRGTLRHLVWCLVISRDCCECDPASADFLEDLLCRGGPYERLGIVVVVLEVCLDRSDQVGHRLEDTAADGFLGELAEPAFDHVQP